MLEDLQIKMSCFSVSELLVTIESLKVESPGLLTLNLVELGLLIGE